MAEKISILGIDGKKTKEIEKPKFFQEKFREDVVYKILETKKANQPYSPSPVAGKQHSASGKIPHRRHVWKTHYGHGMSRIPRKTMLVRGNRFNWTGATIPSAVGGLRAHPPKVAAMINTKKINKKELALAFRSALTATASSKIILKKYSTLEKEDLNVPFVVDSKITGLKTKQLTDALKNILNEGVFEIAIPKKKIRAGKGKMRGRKYKKSAGILIVIGSEEKLKTKIYEVKNVKELSVMDLAKGQPGRLVVYTEKAIDELKKKLGEEK